MCSPLEVCLRFRLENRYCNRIGSARQYAPWLPVSQLPISFRDDIPIPRRSTPFESQSRRHRHTTLFRPLFPVWFLNNNILSTRVHWSFLLYRRSNTDLAKFSSVFRRRCIAESISSASSAYTRAATRTPLAPRTPTSRIVFCIDVIHLFVMSFCNFSKSYMYIILASSKLNIWCDKRAFNSAQNKNHNFESTLCATFVKTSVARKLRVWTRTTSCVQRIIRRWIC